MATEMRIIKKYPNRRLYDTAISSYITLEDVKQLVLEQIPVKVIEARSEEDITHSILLQIIIEQEVSGPSLFSTDSLQKLIRLYSMDPMNSMQQILRPMVEQTMAFFSSQQNFLKEAMKNNASPKAFEKDFLGFMSEQTQKNVENWQQFQQLQQKMQQDWLQLFSTQGNRSQDPSPFSPEDREDKGSTPGSSHR
jgi:polyhydroxyalkanoate synthesis repressor PhaR